MLNVAVIDPERRSADRLLGVLRSHSSVSNVFHEPVLDGAEGRVCDNRINVVYIDPEPFGLEASGRFVDKVRESLAAVVFVIYHSSRFTPVVESNAIFGGYNLCAYFRLPKSSRRLEFPELVRGTIFACVSDLKQIARAAASRDGGAAQTAHDVFISYRRDLDGPVARLLYNELQGRGYRPFLDVVDLGPGHYDDALFLRIKECKNFLVVVSAGSLERCTSPDDWLRKELECALENRKTPIPILMPDWKMPARSVELPDSILNICRHQAVPCSTVYFTAMLDRIVEYLKRRA